MNEHGELTWCLGPSATLRLSQAYTTKDDGSSLSSMKLQLSLTLSGKPQKVPLLMLTQKLSGVCLEIQLAILDALKSASLVDCTLKPGELIRLILEQSPSQITNR